MSTLIASTGVRRTYRGHAIAVGVLLIACTASSILSAASLGSALDGPDHLTQLAPSEHNAVLTALVEFVWAPTGAGVAIARYPVPRRHYPFAGAWVCRWQGGRGGLRDDRSLSLLALLTREPGLAHGRFLHASSSDDPTPSQPKPVDSATPGTASPPPPQASATTAVVSVVRTAR